MSSQIHSVRAITVIKTRPLPFVSAVLFIVSLVVRYHTRHWTNLDLVLMEDWYQHLAQNGWRGLADPTFSNYTPAYLYLLWFTTLFSRWLDPIVSIKLIPTLFDLVSMTAIFLIARLRYTSDEPYVFAAGFFLLPTVMVNSSAWGQIDGMYTAFLLVCAYLVMKEKPFWALVAFGMAISFKAQAIFFLPFLGIMFLKGRIAWYHFLLVPLVYLLLAVPAAMIGRSWDSIITLYVGQVGQFEELAKNAPNLYMFVPNTYYPTGLKLGLLLFAVVMVWWAWKNWRSKAPVTPGRILLIALTGLTLAPFLLPKMHERYFYPADVFSFAVAVLNPELWLLPVLYQFVSSFAYTQFLFGLPDDWVKVVALINTLVAGYVLLQHLRSLRRDGSRGT